MFEFATAGVRPNGRARAIILSLMGLAAACSVASAPALARATYTRIDVAGATATTAGPINGSGEVGGIWRDANGLAHGYLRASDGTISSFDPNKSTAVENVSLNDSGVAAGTFQDANSHEHGFIRTPDAAIVSFDAPGSKGTTIIARMNQSGQVSGHYFDGRQNHGFIRNPDGTFLSYDVPGAPTTVGGPIDDNGAAAGYYYNRTDPQPHGFIRNPDGSFTTYDVPGAQKTWGGVISTRGVVAGGCTDSRAVDHSYIRERDGTITMFDPPGTALEPAYGSHVTAINSKGVVVGYYYDADSFEARAFLRKRDGTFKTFALRRQQTWSGAIGDDGVMTGYYGSHGFIRTP